MLESLRRSYIRMCGPTLSSDGQFPSNLHFDTKTFSRWQEQIKSLLDNDKLIMIARFGSIELDCYNNWVQMVHPERYDEKYRFSILRYIMDKVFVAVSNFFSAFMEIVGKVSSKNIEY